MAQNHSGMQAETAQQEISDSEINVLNLPSRGGKWKAYLELTKPGITKMVVLSTFAGYYLAVPNLRVYFSEPSNIVHCILTIIGTTIVSAGSCALNHYAERDYDKLMKRTMNRPIPTGKITPTSGLIFGIVLTALGMFMLLFVNFFVLFLAAATVVSYVAIYTPMKRWSSLSTLVGGIPGALPAMAGWIAVTGMMSTQAFVMFLILFFWQIPHFLALSWMYRTDYERGGFPMLAVLDKDGKAVAWQAVLYTLVLIPVSLSLTMLGATGEIYFVGALVLGLVFLAFAVQLLRNVNAQNARKLLLSSYFFLMVLMILMFADKA